MLRLPAIALIFVLVVPAVAAAEGKRDSAERRPRALAALYGTYAAMQVLDIVSTRKVLAAGGVEQNPIMRGSTGATIAVKATAGLSTIYFTERAWKKNRLGAIVLIAALNGTTGAIAAHNMHVARR